MGILWPRSSSLEWDNNGDLAEEAVAYFYEAGTSTPKPIYQNGGESTAHENPVEADSARWPAVFIPFGSYKVVIKSAVGGTTLFSADNIPNPAPNDEEVTVDETQLLQTGMTIWFPVDDTLDGFVRANARTIGSASSGATERANADTEDLYVRLYNAMPNTICAVSGGRGANAAADFAANKTLALIDMRGSTAAGLDSMGNTFAGRFNAAIPFDYGGGDTPGSASGQNVHALTTAQLASHTHTFAATTGNNNVNHTHTFSTTSGTESADHTHDGTTSSNGAHAHTVSGGTTGGTGNFPTGQGGGSTSFPSPATTIVIDSGGAHTHTMTTGGKSATHTHSVSGTSDTENTNHTHAVSGTTGSNGSGDFHNNMQRTVLGTWFIKL